MTNRLFVGIDPGVEGAIAILNEEEGWTTIAIPEINNFFDTSDLLSECIYPSYDDIVYIENVWKPNKLVRLAGMLEGIFLSAGAQVYHVAPSTWRKEILGYRLATKQDAIDYCLKVYPIGALLRTINSKVPDHNFAEALCIAEYCKRKHGVYINE